jgi:preprotein translocase subunit YajC
MNEFIALSLAMSGQTGAEGGSPFVTLMPLVLVMFIFYFLILRPQQKRQKEHRQMLEAVAKGDKVLTNGGIYMTIVDVKDDRFYASPSDGVRVELAKNAIAAVVTKKGQKN